MKGKSQTTEASTISPSVKSAFSSMPALLRLLIFTPWRLEQDSLDRNGNSRGSRLGNGQGRPKEDQPRIRAGDLHVQLGLLRG